jgi:hypothetical protein
MEDTVPLDDGVSEDAEEGGETSGEALERVADSITEQIGPPAGNSRGLPGSRVRPEPATRELQELSEKLQVAGDARNTPKPVENPRQSFDDVVAEAREAIDDGGNPIIETERIRHAAQLETLDLQARLSASLTYGIDSWDSVGAEVATAFWDEIREQVDAVYASLAIGNEEFPESFEPRAAEAQESAIWWMKKCGELTILQFVTAMALGYGRPEDEIKEVLGVQRHEILFWTEEFPAFGEMREFWRQRWEERAERHEQNTIDMFMQHADPRLQTQAVHMMNQRVRTKDGLRRTDLQKEGLEVQRDRAELERDMATRERQSPRARADIRILIDQGMLTKKGHAQDELPPARDADYIDVEPDEAEDE